MIMLHTTLICITISIILSFICHVIIMVGDQVNYKKANGIYTSYGDIFIKNKNILIILLIPIFNAFFLLILIGGAVVLLWLKILVITSDKFLLK
jgi:hypothetical protein